MTVSKPITATEMLAHTEQMRIIDDEKFRIAWQRCMDSVMELLFPLVLNALETPSRRWFFMDNKPQQDTGTGSSDTEHAEMRHAADAGRASHVEMIDALRKETDMYAAEARTFAATDPLEYAFMHGNEHILQFFRFGHLPPHLARISAPFARLALQILARPRNPERTVALRKLLESKDAAVRAEIAE